MCGPRSTVRESRITPAALAVVPESEEGNARAGGAA